MADIKPNFEGLADNYSQNRPQYPQRLLSKLGELLPNRPLQVVDLGCGTGISTRAIAKVLASKVDITGIDLSKDMLRRAEEDTSEEAPIRYEVGAAEALSIGDGMVDLIFVGQALHWFDRIAFYTEARRILKPGGVVAIAQNTRNWRKSKLAADYEAFYEKYLPNFSRSEREFDVASELDNLEWVESALEFEEEWSRPMKIATFLGMAQSSSKVTQALDISGWDNGIAELSTMARRHIDDDGFIVLPYISVMICAVKNSSSVAHLFEPE